MNRIETITYYSFGWLIMFFLNFGKWNKIPRWFWGIGYCDGPIFRIVWLGFFAFSWEPQQPFGQKNFQLDWNID